jgi:hypothetical protein
MSRLTVVVTLLVVLGIAAARVRKLKAVGHAHRDLDLGDEQVTSNECYDVEGV